ncbi:MAG: hypothetical protein ACLQBJ_18895 [Bryobacteraceae bacterium]
MRRIVRGLKLGVLLVAALGCRGQWDAGKLIRSDAAQLPAAEVHRFLEMICPGQTSDSGCKVCPKDTAFTPPASTQTWDLKAIIPGHFLSLSSDDTVVSGLGCEPHANGMSGSYLFTREGPGWRKVRYEAGVKAFDCKKMTGLDSRDRLVCAAYDMHQGFGDEFLYLLDPGRDPRTLNSQNDTSRGDIFFDVGDSLQGCVRLADGTVLSGAMERVEFVPLEQDRQVRIVVTARLGRAVVPNDIFRKACAPGLSKGLRLATVLRRYSFVFDGQDVVSDADNPPLSNRAAVAPRTSYTSMR